MNKEQLGKANQLSKEIIDLKEKVESANKYEELLGDAIEKKETSFFLDCGWSSWPRVYIKKEVAEVAVSLTIKKLEKELDQLTTEFENL